MNQINDEQVKEKKTTGKLLLFRSFMNKSVFSVQSIILVYKRKAHPIRSHSQSLSKR